MRLLSLLLCAIAISAYGQRANNISPSKKYLLSNIVVHEFSNTAKRDTFKLLMTGKSILKSKVVFQIVSFDKRKIYTINCVGADMLGDLTDMGWPEKRYEDTIKKRFNHFFDKSSFSKPALHRDDKWDTNNAEKMDFNDIKINPKAIGFTYNWGYESTNEIAYSQRRKKVVVCFYSD